MELRGGSCSCCWKHSLEEDWIGKRNRASTDLLQPQDARFLSYLFAVALNKIAIDWNCFAVYEIFVWGLGLLFVKMEFGGVLDCQLLD